MIMAALAQEKSYYTYADVLEWDEDVRAEIIDGDIFMIAPPVRFHQDIIWEMSRQFGNFLQGKPCKGYAAPFGVRLFPLDDQSDDTYVEPDMVVVCDSSKLDAKGCNGAPDLIIEVLSPSTARQDRVVKFRKYLEAGVREYWVVNPEEKTVQVHVLDNGRYVTKTYDETDEVQVTVLPGCVIALPLVFGQS
jgi:Uma2 family endonuclease